jgi:hypothetical protein
MARMPDLVAFAQHHGLKLGTIADLIAHRRRTEKLVRRVQEGEVEQAIGGTAAVFGDASKEIDKFVDSSVDLVGLSEAAARSLTTRLGASLKATGLSAEEAADRSIQLVTIGADLAATFGGTTEEAVTALGAALRGEYDPLERFGVALKQEQRDLVAIRVDGVQECDAARKARSRREDGRDGEVVGSPDRWVDVDRVVR